MSVTEVEVNGRGSFIVKYSFFEEELKLNRILLYFFPSCFLKKLFGKTVAKVKKSILKVRRFSSDDCLAETPVTEIGKISFAHFWELLCNQGHGNAGPLLIEKYAHNFAMVEGCDGDDLILGAYWDPLIDIDMCGYACAWLVLGYTLEDFNSYCKSGRNYTVISY